MKDYRPGRWGVAFIFSLEGSVLPRALCCALPNALLAVAVWYFWRKNVVDSEYFEDSKEGTDTGQVWTGYNWVLGFTVAFRAQRAYARWWEGGTLLQQARGEWFNAYSSLIAFCTSADSKRAEVKKFQQILARLMSMLYASALMSIATEPDLDFEIIDVTGLNLNHLDYLRTQPDKCEIIMQWIQRLIVDNMGSNVLPIPPPVISRVFQELSRGIVNIHNVRKITEFQFPFPAAQMIVVMLIVQWLLTPMVTGLLVGTPAWAFVLSFFPIFACWGINYLAGELEQPFGTDYNDMPLHFMQASMNTSILALLDHEAQSPPDFDMTQRRLQSVMVDPGKACATFQNLDPMRSVRFVTIYDVDQLNRVKHRFTQGRDFGEQGRVTRRSSMIRKGLTHSFSLNADGSLPFAERRSDKSVASWLSDGAESQVSIEQQLKTLPVTKERETGRKNIYLRQATRGSLEKLCQEEQEALSERERPQLRQTSGMTEDSTADCAIDEHVIQTPSPQDVPDAGAIHPHALPCDELPADLGQVVSPERQTERERQRERGTDEASTISERDKQVLPRRILVFSSETDQKEDESARPRRPEERETADRPPDRQNAHEERSGFLTASDDCPEQRGQMLTPSQVGTRPPERGQLDAG